MLQIAATLAMSLGTAEVAGKGEGRCGALGFVSIHAPAGPMHGFVSDIIHGLLAMFGC